MLKKNNKITTTKLKLKKNNEIITPKLQASIPKKIGIVGAGPAGLTAALYAARAGLDVTVFYNGDFGQLTYTQHVENFPGIEKSNGFEIMNTMYKQVKNLGVKFEIKEVTLVHQIDNEVIFEINSNEQYIFNGCIIATGATPKWLNIPSENKFKNYGVSSCAICDGYFSKNKDVAVIGGGNTALEDVLFLSKIAKTVTLIHRRDALRAEYLTQQLVFKLPNVRFKWNSIVTEFCGNEEPEKALTHLQLQCTESRVISTLNVQAAFVAIGHSPNSDLIKHLIPIDSNGYIKSNNVSTNVPNIFVAGDVYDSKYRQAITAASQGCMAVMELNKFLNK